MLASGNVLLTKNCFAHVENLFVRANLRMALGLNRVLQIDKHENVEMLKVSTSEGFTITASKDQLILVQYKDSLIWTPLSEIRHGYWLVLDHLSKFRNDFNYELRDYLRPKFLTGQVVIKDDYIHYRLNTDEPERDQLRLIAYGMMSEIHKGQLYLNWTYIRQAFQFFDIDTQPLNKFHKYSKYYKLPAYGSITEHRALVTNIEEVGLDVGYELSCRRPHINCNGFIVHH